VSGHARGHERWVINKIRALCSWYSKGLDGGSHLRVRVNAAENLDHLRAIIGEYFGSPHHADCLMPNA
jgi:tRNA-dihydrouridine synthase